MENNKANINLWKGKLISYIRIYSFSTKERYKFTFIMKTKRKELIRIIYKLPGVLKKDIDLHL